MARTDRWRVGSKVPLNVYDGSRPVCQCHNPEDAARIVEAMNLYALYTADQWTEDDGDVLWWHVPVQGPPYVGTPPSDRYDNATICRQLIADGWLTHWSRIPNLSGLANGVIEPVVEAKGE